MRVVLLLTLSTIAVPDRPDPNPNPRKDNTPAQQILGEWAFDKLNIAGIGQPPMAELQQRTMEFTPTQILVRVNGMQRDADGADYKIDWTKSPATFDMVPRNGQKKIEGIVKLEGDQLAIYFALTGARPTDFKLDGPGTIAVMEFKRVKK